MALRPGNTDWSWDGTSWSSLCVNLCPGHWGKIVFFLWTLLLETGWQAGTVKPMFFVEKPLDRQLFVQLSKFKLGLSKEVARSHNTTVVRCFCLLPKCWVGDQAEGEQKPETVMLLTVVLWGCKNNTARWGQALSLAIKTCTGKENPKYTSCGYRKEHWNHNQYVIDGSQTIW